MEVASRESSPEATSYCCYDYDDCYYSASFYSYTPTPTSPPLLLQLPLLLLLQQLLRRGLRLPLPRRRRGRRLLENY